MTKPHTIAPCDHPGATFAARSLLSDQARLLDVIRLANRQLSDMCSMMADRLGPVGNPAATAHLALSGAGTNVDQLRSTELLRQVSRTPALLLQVAQASRSVGINLDTVAAGLQQAISRLALADPDGRPGPVRPASSGQHVVTDQIANHQLVDRIVAIGASTGGIEAIQSVLCGLKGAPLAFVITQHLPPGFVRGFAEQLTRVTGYDVRQAEDGDLIRPGTVFLAPGDCHLTLTGSRNTLSCRLDDGPPVSGCKPSVDVMFGSVARTVGAKAIGILLTGMGRDGAEGLLTMRNFRALTLCESEQSAVAFGMPKAGLAIGAATESVPLDAIPDWILEAAAERPMPPPQIEEVASVRDETEANTPDSQSVHFLP